MGFFGGGAPSKVSAISEIPETPKYLEDLPPKFEDSAPAARPNDGATYQQALSTVKIQDFSPSLLVMIPCFRDAMLTGFLAMAVLGAVTFVMRKDVSKSINWAVGGFFLGNIVGWEQCRSIRKRSFQNVEKARQRNQERNINKFKEASSEDGVDRWEKESKK